MQNRKAKQTLERDIRKFLDLALPMEVVAEASADAPLRVFLWFSERDRRSTSPALTIELQSLIDKRYPRRKKAKAKKGSTKK